MTKKNHLSQFQCDESMMCTFVESTQWFQYSSLQSRVWVLDAGAQTQRALQLRRLMQKLSIRRQLRSFTQHSCHVVNKLRDQTSVTVISLTEMIRDHLQRQTGGNINIQTLEHIKKLLLGSQTCPASLLRASSCLLLISGVPGQLPPPPSSPPPPRPKESWEKDAASAPEERRRFELTKI